VREGCHQARSSLIDIVITGANGVVGTALIRYLRKGPRLSVARVRALVRSVNRAESLRALRVEVVEADYDIADLLRAAVAGADAIVHLAGALLPRRGETLFEANVESTRKVVEAALAAGVKRIVYLSFPGADPTSDNEYLRSKGMAEDLIRRAGFSGAIFRVPMILGAGSPSLLALTKMAASPLVPLVGGGSVRIQPVAQSDVLAAIAWAIESVHGSTRILDLVGPETLSYAELLSRIGRRLGRKPWIVNIPKKAAWLSAVIAGRCIPSLGWNKSVFDILFNEHLADPTEGAETMSIALTTLEEALEQAYSPVR
jgi:uncharacterized protein YbjT (DUF2867 family)